jgi:DNA-binding MarR family transcriptional regulator
MLTWRAVLMTDSASPAQICADAALDFMQSMTRFLIAEGRELDPAIRITPPQFRALVLLERAPGMSLSELGAEMGIRTPTASVIVVRLVQQGLVQRSSGGGRRLALSLSAQGKKQLNTARKHIQLRLSESLAAWPASKLQQSAQVLQELQQVLHGAR